MDRFGDRLRNARTMVGLTQEQLGFSVGVSKSSVSAWENNRERPSFQVLPALRQALQGSLDMLVCGDTSAQELQPKYLATQVRDAREQRLLQRYRELTARQKSALLELLSINLLYEH